jgi:glycosyltransferase involved in cell wall biosynthesis
VSRPRIAWITPYLPFPENGGGRIRIARLAAGLARHADVSLFSRIASDDRIEDAQLLASEPQWARVVTAKPGRRGSLLVPSSAQSQPGTLLAEALSAKEPFAALLFSHAYAAGALPRHLPTPLLFEEQNIESDYFAKAIRTEPKKVVRHSLDFARMRRLERRLWRRSKLVCVVREEDAQIVGKFAPRTAVVPNGVSCSALSRKPPSLRTGNGILFTGTMSYEPNIRAAMFLANEVLPLVRREIPDATLTLAGRNPHARVRALASASVRVTGTVPSVAPLLDEHAVCAMPIPFGGGTSLKVVEAFAAELPMVGNAVSVRGFGVVDGTHYLGAETREEFAQALVRVLSRRADFDGMTIAARAVAERHDWVRLGEEFATAILAVI